jgi:hypothetical protein
MATKITYPDQSVNSIITAAEFNQIKAGVNGNIDDTISAQSDIDALETVVAGKVDKISNKQLSTEDYTTAEKSKLAGIAPGATAYTDAQAQSANAAALSGKVDKVNGKQLSTEDYTTTEKTKLSGVAPNATANATDAQLRDRSTHTGTQTASTISDFASAARANPSTGIVFTDSTPVTATDTDIVAKGKLQAQISANTTAIGNKVGNDTDAFASTPKITQIVTLTQAEYDAIVTKVDTTLYLIQ